MPPPDRNVFENWSPRPAIEGPDGQSMAFPAYFPLRHAHTHYCAAHDHRWRCVVDPCRRHEFIDCVYVEVIPQINAAT